MALKQRLEWTDSSVPGAGAARPSPSIDALSSLHVRGHNVGVMRVGPVHLNTVLQIHASLLNSYNRASLAEAATEGNELVELTKIRMRLLARTLMGEAINQDMLTEAGIPSMYDLDEAIAAEHEAEDHVPGTRLQQRQRIVQTVLDLCKAALPEANKLVSSVQVKSSLMRSISTTAINKWQVPPTNLPPL
eukprot:TRINITY_DN25395_c0_g1_i1.p1 TRINITY_DN25395_c0_g1~~TRINITY_DN25395_c0_g1_i1.p1  ORF type:complete len:199 (-),score=61.44 TRINITY_DN25395_c0_g1_i1:31-600(-)